MFDKRIDFSFAIISSFGLFLRYVYFKTYLRSVIAFYISINVIQVLLINHKSKFLYQKLIKIFSKSFLDLVKECGCTSKLLNIKKTEYCITLFTVMLFTKLENIDTKN